MIELHSPNLPASIEGQDFAEEPTYGGDSSTPITLRDLPRLALPAVELLYVERPDIVIANDKGARLFAFAIFQTWKAQYPYEKFPGVGGGIDFLRVSRDDNSDTQPAHRLKTTIERSGHKEQAPRLLFLDDWVQTGDTIRRFIKIAGTMGVGRENITFVTMCGRGTDEVKHHVMDGSVDPRNSMWNPFPEYTGVDYQDGQPYLLDRTMALQARAKIKSGVEAATYPEQMSA